MADIFLSYSSTNRPRAKQFADALEQLGWDVWWDREIELGDHYNKVIPEEIKKARCVVVLWSEKSTQSNWVYEEAVKGRDRGILIPALIEPVEIPMGFGTTQAANLVDWEPGVTHTDFEQFVENIRRVLKSPTPIKLQTESRHLRKFRKALWYAVPMLLIGAAALAAMYWRLPTRVKLDAYVDRLQFTLGGSESVALLESTPFRTLTVQRFHSVTFEPAQIALGDNSRSDDGGNIASDAWQALNVPPRVEFSGAQQSAAPALTLRAQLPGTPMGKLEALALEPGAKVSLTTEPIKASKERVNLLRLGLVVEGQRVQAQVSPRNVFLIDANHALAAALPATEASATYRAQLSETRTRIHINGRDDVLDLKLRLDARAMNLLPGSVPVTQVELLKPRSGVGGISWDSALAGDASLSYPDYPTVAAVKIGRSDFLGLHQLDRFSVQSVGYDTARQAMHIELDGKAGKIDVKSGEFVRDHRLSVMDRLWNSQKMVILVGVLAAAWSLIGALRAAWGEMRAQRA